ncbi:MAG TPA: hypothetical protein PLQ88_21625, partial [Blastocatellia bacterium]|nr:hypothetical protein [Blastocatellia bacterium]
MKVSNFKLALICALVAAAISQWLFQPVSSAAATRAITLDTTKPAGEVTAPAGGWRFRNHVIPVLTRLGCNSGA